MRWLLLAVVALVADGCADEGGSVNEGGERWPHVRSYCSPDQPGVRVYETALMEDGYGSAGGGVAVIADVACGGK